MMTRFLLAAAAITLPTLASADPSDVFFVNKQSAATVEDGLSWGTAFDTIQEGIDAAREAFGGEVWVARGTYSEERNSPTGSLNLRSGVDVYGGFEGIETERGERDSDENLTTISGTRARNGGAASPVVDGADNSVLDGFTIRGGRGAIGAGMLNLGESPVVRNCIFTDNEATDVGGAVLTTEGATPLFFRCQFVENSAVSNGGAVVNTESDATFEECTFTGNISGGAGGAMFNTPGSEVSITGCTFTENTATVGGGAIFSEGAEIAINASTFIANSTPGFGGALFTNEAANPTKSADTLITNSVLARNTAHGGGAWATLASSVTSVNCTIVGNTSEDDALGGAFFNNAADTEVINAIIWYNSSEWVANLDGSFTEIRWSNVGGGDPGPDNIAAEPRFVNRASDDYRLMPDSPSIDTGCTECATDLDILGSPRLLDGADQGAYESTAKAPDSPQCHGEDEAPTSAMPDPVSALLLAALILAARRK